MKGLVHRMKEYLSIGELANIFGMDVQLLRYYDARGILVPSVRNESNGRRYYHFDVTLNIIDQFSEGPPGSYDTALETRILPA